MVGLGKFQLELLENKLVGNYVNEHINQNYLVEYDAPNTSDKSDMFLGIFNTNWDEQITKSAFLTIQKMESIYLLSWTSIFGKYLFTGIAEKNGNTLCGIYKSVI